MNGRGRCWLRDGLSDDVEHPNVEKYPGQRLLVVAVNDYAYAVPYVQTAEGIYLKTAFPSRKLKALYMPSPKPPEEHRP